MSTFDLSEDPEYGFAVGRVRSLEAALMDRVRYERFVRARDAAEFVSALGETAYARFLGGQTPAVGQAFDGASGENAEFLCSYARDEWLKQLIRLPGLFRSLKAALKEAAQRGEATATIPDGFAGEPARSIVAALAVDAIAMFAEGNGPAVIDAMADRAMQEVQLRVAGHSRFVRGLLGLHADLENLRAFVRVRARPGAETNGAADLRRAFLPGGRLALDDLTAALPEPWPEVVERLAKAPPFGVGDEAFREYLDLGRPAEAGRRAFVRLERHGREMELRYLRQTRYATFGYEPLVTFFLMSENELRNLRLLYAAKLAGLADDEARDLVACVE